MAEKHPLLWDLVDQGENRERAVERAEMENVRRKKIKKLRATSQWLTVMRVARQIKQPFMLNDLSVACFNQDSVNFGLKGYPQYPDNHRIHYILYGEKGLIAAGLLKRVSQGLFEVGDEADEILSNLAAGSMQDKRDGNVEKSEARRRGR
jgi:hypothetical protein